MSEIKRVVLLCLDGMGRFSKSVKTPALDALCKAGASSFQASAGVPTDSGPNWGSVLHGVSYKKHGISNDIAFANIPFSEDSDYPSVPKILQQKRSDFKVASFVAWEPINTAIIEQSVRGKKYSPVINEPFWMKWWLRIRHKWLKASAYDGLVVSEVEKFLETPEGKELELFIVHLVDVDETGHMKGFGSQEYLKMIEKEDEYVARIVSALEKANMLEDSLLLVTTDHGGKGKGHGGFTSGEVDIFLIARGPGVAPNSTIAANARNMDCAAITLRALGMKIPTNFDARVPAGVFTKQS